MSTRTVVDISPGDAHVVVITSDGMVYGWSTTNTYGEAGDGVTTSGRNYFVLSTSMLAGMLCGEYALNVYAAGYNSMVTTNFGRLLILGANPVRLLFLLTYIIVWSSIRKN